MDFFSHVTLHHPIWNFEIDMNMLTNQKTFTYLNILVLERHCKMKLVRKLNMNKNHKINKSKGWYFASNNGILTHLFNIYFLAWRWYPIECYVDTLMGISDMIDYKINQGCISIIEYMLMFLTAPFSKPHGWWQCSITHLYICCYSGLFWDSNTKITCAIVILLT